MRAKKFKDVVAKRMAERGQTFSTAAQSNASQCATNKAMASVARKSLPKCAPKASKKPRKLSVPFTKGAGVQWSAVQEGSADDEDSSHSQEGETDEEDASHSRRQDGAPSVAVKEEDASYCSTHSGAESLDASNDGALNIPAAKEDGARGKLLGYALNARTLATATSRYAHGESFIEEHDSCVWPPMLMVTTWKPEQEFSYRAISERVMRLLATAGVRLKAVKHILGFPSPLYVQGGDPDARASSLLVLPPTGAAFLAAKAIDTLFHAEGSAHYLVHYPDARDIRAHECPKALVNWSPLVCDSEVYLPGAESNIHKEDDEAGFCAIALYDTVRNALQGIQRCEDELELVKESAEPENKFIEKLMAFEENSMKEIKVVLADIDVHKNSMQQLWSVNCTLAANECANRLQVLHKLYRPGVDGDLMSKVIKSGEEQELKVLKSIEKEVQLQKQREWSLRAITANTGRIIYKLREKQHMELMEKLRIARGKAVSFFEEMVGCRREFVEGIRTVRKETDSIQGLICERTATAIAKVEENHKLERMTLEQQHQAKEVDLQNSLVKAEMDLESARSEIGSTQTALQIAQCALENGRTELQLMQSELESRRTELKDAHKLLERFECTVCFHKLEGSWTHKRGAEMGAPFEPRKRACFFPCMHATVCTDCSVAIWKESRKCPLCNTVSVTEPQALHF